mmetsp:Transcript_75924/g.203414  ORF Transcript_75924/g.203414 Transcript_75924/m.203414 type:complete len:301 (-) Transcript_75924:975-1877(-)
MPGCSAMAWKPWVAAGSQSADHRMTASNLPVWLRRSSTKRKMQGATTRIASASPRQYLSIGARPTPFLSSSGRVSSGWSCRPWDRSSFVRRWAPRISMCMRSASARRRAMNADKVDSPSHSFGSGEDWTRTRAPSCRSPVQTMCERRKSGAPPRCRRRHPASIGLSSGMCTLEGPWRWMKRCLFSSSLLEHPRKSTPSRPSRQSTAKTSVERPGQPRLVATVVLRRGSTLVKSWFGDPRESVSRRTSARSRRIASINARTIISRRSPMPPPTSTTTHQMRSTSATRPPCTVWAQDRYARA